MYLKSFVWTDFTEHVVSNSFRQSGGHCNHRHRLQNERTDGAKMPIHLPKLTAPIRHHMSLVNQYRQQAPCEFRVTKDRVDESCRQSQFWRNEYDLLISSIDILTMFFRTAQYSETGHTRHDLWCAATTASVYSFLKEPTYATFNFGIFEGEQYIPDLLEDINGDTIKVKRPLLFSWTWGPAAMAVSPNPVAAWTRTSLHLQVSCASMAVIYSSWVDEANPSVSVSSLQSF